MADSSDEHMTDRSDVTAFEHMLNYVSEEAQRLRVSTVVVRCLQMAVDELAQADGHPQKVWPENPSLH
jgi:hypothetical protein